MADKIFVGKVWDDKFAIAKLQFNGEDIDKLKQHFQASSDAKVTVLIKQSLSGKRYAEIDQWKPTQQSAPQQNKQQASNNFYAPPADIVDDLPF